MFKYLFIQIISKNVKRYLSAIFINLSKYLTDKKGFEMKF